MLLYIKSHDLKKDNEEPKITIYGIYQNTFL